MAVKGMTRSPNLGTDESYFETLNQELIQNMRQKAKSPPKRGHLRLVPTPTESKLPSDASTPSASIRKKAA